MKTPRATRFNPQLTLLGERAEALSVNKVNVLLLYEAAWCVIYLIFGLDFIRSNLWIAAIRNRLLSKHVF
jgi:hypothetical protein